MSLTAVFTTAQALSTRSATVTPLWAAVWVMMKYRTRNNYMSGMYMLGRLFDKVHPFRPSCHPLRAQIDYQKYVAVMGCRWRVLQMTEG